MVWSLQEVLKKEGQTSSDLRTTLEEERGKAEAEVSVLRVQVFELKEQVSELKARIPSLVSEASARAVEEFKASSEIEDLKVQFGQDAFIKGFELYQEKVARKFPELDLNFLGEESEDETGPSPAATAVAAPLPGTSSSPTPAPEV